MPINSITIPNTIYCGSSNQKAMELFQTGKDALDIGMTDQAQKLFYYAVQKDTNFCDANYYLGYTYRLKNDWEHAASYYLAAYEINDSVPHITQNLGHSLLILGYYDKSVAIYSRLVEINPNDPEGYYGISMAKEALGEDDTALTNLNKSIDLYKEKRMRIGPEVTYLLGILYAKTEKYNLSIKELKGVYGKFGNQPEINYYLGISYYYDKSNVKIQKRNDNAKKYLIIAKDLGVEIEESILIDLSIN